MSIFNKLSKKNLASERLWRQIFGAIIQWRPKAFWAFLVSTIPCMGITYILTPQVPLWPDKFFVFLQFLILNLVVWLTIKVCRRLLEVFNLKKDGNSITWCYVTILFTIGLWIISFVFIFHIESNGSIATALGVIGSLLTWIFQDKIKGVVTFFHLRLHQLLNIDDWLIVDKLGVDGEVQRITLTSVIVYNWDTTTSTIPINALQTEHFINLKNMIQLQAKIDDSLNELFREEDLNEAKELSMRRYAMDASQLFANFNTNKANNEDFEKSLLQGVEKIKGYNKEQHKWKKDISQYAKQTKKRVDQLLDDMNRLHVGYKTDDSFKRINEKTSAVIISYIERCPMSPYNIGFVRILQALYYVGFYRGYDMTVDVAKVGALVEKNKDLSYSKLRSTLV